MLCFMEHGDDACGLGTRHVVWVANEGLTRAPRTSPKMESEIFVVRRKERDARIADQPGSSIMRTVRCPALLARSLGIARCSRAEFSPLHARVRLKPRVVLDRESVKEGTVYPARTSESGIRNCTPRRHTYVSGMSGAFSWSS